VAALRNVRHMAIRDLEDVSSFTLSDEAREELLAAQDQCTVNWTTRAGYPMGMPHSFVWSDGRFWVHTTTKRKRVRALTDRPESCIVVSSIGTGLPSGMVSAKTRATVHHGDRDKVRWLLPLFWDRVGMTPKDAEAADQLWALFDTPARVVIEFDPVDVFTWSSVATTAAVLDGGFDRWEANR
jgi:hypothetical protein